MRLYVGFAVAIAMLASIGSAQPTDYSGPYKVLKTAKVGGVGGYDYVYADANGRRLYIARTRGQPSRITVFDLDTLAPAGRNRLYKFAWSGGRFQNKSRFRQQQADPDV